MECADGIAKFWLDPVVSLVNYDGLTRKRLQELQKVIEGRKHEIIRAWNKHFGS